MAHQARGSRNRNGIKATTTRAMSSDPGGNDAKPSKSQAPAVTPGLDFQFITTVGSIERDDATRRKVRSHAKRSALKGSREARVLDGPGEASSAAGTALEDKPSSTSQLPLRPVPQPQSQKEGTSRFKLVDLSAAASSSKSNKKRDKDERKQQSQGRASQALIRRRRDAAAAAAHSEAARVRRDSQEQSAGEPSAVDPEAPKDRKGKGIWRASTAKEDHQLVGDGFSTGPLLGPLPKDMNPATAELLKFCK